MAAVHDDKFVKYNEAHTTNMLVGCEVQCGCWVTRQVATAMIRAAANWLFDKIGPGPAYEIVQTVADEIGLRIATWGEKPKPERKR